MIESMKRKPRIIIFQLDKLGKKWVAEGFKGDTSDVSTNPNNLRKWLISSPNLYSGVFAPISEQLPISTEGDAENII